ncbi:hypothetical protein Dimus_012896 [Dionaea muscipula]
MAPVPHPRGDRRKSVNSTEACWIPMLLLLLSLMWPALRRAICSMSLSVVPWPDFGRSPEEECSCLIIESCVARELVLIRLIPPQYACSFPASSLSLASSVADYVDLLFVQQLGCVVLLPDVGALSCLLSGVPLASTHFFPLRG